MLSPDFMLVFLTALQYRRCPAAGAAEDPSARKPALQRAWRPVASTRAETLRDGHTRGTIPGPTACARSGPLHVVEEWVATRNGAIGQAIDRISRRSGGPRQSSG